MDLFVPPRLSYLQRGIRTTCCCKPIVSAIVMGPRKQEKDVTDPCPPDDEQDDETTEGPAAAADTLNAEGNKKKKKKKKKRTNPSAQVCMYSMLKTFNVTTSPGVGRCVVASRDLTEGELVLDEPPFAKVSVICSADVFVAEGI